jgi:multisubunit Na+/H+ antiporter MnhC subunit
VVAELIDAVLAGRIFSRARTICELADAMGRSTTRLVSITVLRHLWRPASGQTEREPFEFRGLNCRQSIPVLQALLLTVMVVGAAVTFAGDVAAVARAHSTRRSCDPIRS